MKVFGIDGCKTGWAIWCVEEGGIPNFSIVEKLSDIEEELVGNLALIDIPIGFSDAEHPDRLCDKAARKFLAPKRGSSVFPVPCRQAVYAESYQQSCDINQKVLGKKLSKQTWNILSKVREVDERIEANSDLMLRESHPEVVFTALNGQQLNHSKKTLEGRQERIDILQRYQPDWIPMLSQVIETTKKVNAAPDDIIDAFALMLIALKGSELTSLPQIIGSSSTLPEIVYWQPNSHQ